MNFKEVIALLFDHSPGTWYRWKKEERLIVELIEKYFSKMDLEEFVKTKQISKLDKYYHEVSLLKLSKLGIREKAILFHVLKKNDSIKTKSELVDAINNFDLVVLLKQQLSKSFREMLKLNIFPKFSDLDSTGGYPLDRSNLSKYIENKLYEFEIKAWLKDVDFSF